MQRTPPILRPGLATFFVSALLAGAGLAQERQHVPPPPYSDAKTAPEPSLPVTPAPEHPVVGPPRALPEKPADDAAARAPRRIDHSRMYYDEPGDGRVWVRGADYKASFGADGAIYYPRFGSRAPANVPHALSPDTVTFGGEAIEFARAAPAIRRGDRVELDRGAFVEAYDFTPASVEQTFVFATLPRAGDLVVTIPVASALEGRAEEAGLEFRGDLGRITYSRAVAVDAAGQRIGARTELIDGAITIRVDAAFLASAVLPLVIDPVIATFPVDSGPSNTYSSDVAWDANYFCWLSVYEEVYSISDHDIHALVMNWDGSVRYADYVDYTTASWTEPRCANLNAYSQCLVAATRIGSPSLIVGREVSMANIAMNAQITISQASDGPAERPVVGGDPYTIANGLSYYCVAYERRYSSDDWDILFQLVRADNTLVGGGPTYLSNSGGTIDVRAGISKSNQTGDWMIVWDRVLLGGGDIWGARVRYDGAIQAAPFQITSGGAGEGVASVSSPLNGYQYLVAYQLAYGNDYDVVLALVDHSTVLSTMNLSVEEGFDSTRRQIEPAVDTDGEHYVVVYAELWGGDDYDIYAAELGVSGTDLALVAGHQNLAYSTTPEVRPRIAGLSPAGEPPGFVGRDLFVTWDDDALFGGGNIEAGVYQGSNGGPKSPFCFGDGGGTPCPCSNDSASGSQAGCLNSFGLAGRLVATGVASTLSDTVVLTATGLPAGSAPPNFIQGTAQSNGGLGTVFGDGLRCAVGSVIRLGSPPSSGGTASYGYGVPGTELVSVRGALPPAGATRYYQVIYRNSAAFCTSATFNSTNGVRIAWIP